MLELWYFQYERKPTNENGAELAPIGGQEVTDDGYLNEHWTHYLTVLHYTSGEQTGYQIIGTYTGNDGLWYNGCSYSGEEKYYLHDFYIDYAGLDLPKMFIPNLLNDTGNGRLRPRQPVRGAAHFGRRQLLLLCADHRLGVQSGDGVLVLPLRHRLLLQRKEARAEP